MSEHYADDAYAQDEFYDVAGEEPADPSAYAPEEDAGPEATLAQWLGEIVAARDRFEEAQASLEDGATNAVNAASREALNLNRLVLAVCAPDGEHAEYGPTALKVLAAADKADPKAQVGELARRFGSAEVLRADEHLRLARVFADVGLAQLKDHMVAAGLDLAAVPPACMSADDLQRMPPPALRAYLQGHADRLEGLHINAQLYATSRLCEGMLPSYPDLELTGKLLVAALVVAPPQHQGKVFETFTSRINPYHRGPVLVAAVLHPSIDRLRLLEPAVRVALALGQEGGFITRDVGLAMGKVLVSLRMDAVTREDARAAADIVRKAVPPNDRALMLAGVVAALPPDQLATTTPEQAEGLVAAVAVGPAEDRQLLMRLLLGLLRAGEEAEPAFLRAFARADAIDPGKIAPAIVRGLALGEAAGLPRGAVETLYHTLVEAGASRVLLRQLEEALV